jgi:hypothetical protein
VSYYFVDYVTLCLTSIHRAADDDGGPALMPGSSPELRDLDDLLSNQRFRYPSAIKVKLDSLSLVSLQ